MKEKPFRAAVATVLSRDDLVRAYRSIEALGEPLRIVGQTPDRSYGTKSVKLPAGLKAHVLQTLLASIRVEEEALRQKYSVIIKGFDPTHAGGE